MTAYNRKHAAESVTSTRRVLVRMKIICVMFVTKCVTYKIIKNGIKYAICYLCTKCVTNAANDRKYAAKCKIAK